MPEITITHKISSINIGRGETITIWLNKAVQPEFNQVQVELRVKPDGTPEIFSSEPILLQSFDKWESIKE